MSCKTAPYDYMFKLLLIGDTGVGKSCLLLRFSDDKFTPTYIATIGIDFRIKTLEIDGKRFKLQIWDTAGQERFRSITCAYYRGAQGILLVYDSTNSRTFKSIANWMRTIEMNATEAVEKILIGNKCDKEDEIAVKTPRGKALADEYGMPFFETSAKTNTNVFEAFISITQALQKRVATLCQPIPTSITTTLPQKKETCC